MWQDYVLGIGSFFFGVVLIPSIISNDKPSLMTSIPTAIILFVLAATYLSLDLLLATASVLITAICWTILAVQKFRMDSKKE